MAEKRSVHQSTIMAQMHKAGHASPPPPAPSSVVQDSSASRGPRTLLLRRSENGFGFTLRHFIVYPPESCCMLPGHERTKIDEPMDTIFVKQVRENSPAAEAGLRTGDRVVSVDGVPTRGEQYARVVQRIQQADPWLRLLVVSKEDDILQRYFGETAHNPETNPRPRLRSPERLSQKHRRSMSVIPGATPRTRQSWVCSSLGSENQSCGLRGREEAYKDQKPSKMSVLADTMQRRPLQEARNQESTGLYERSDERECRRGAPSEMMMDSPSQVLYRSSPDSRFDLYDRTRPESIYSRPSSEQIYDRIKDPIYEHVRMRPNDDQTQRLRYPVSRAEPQVPIYRASRRVVTRRASEGSSGATDSEIANFGSVDALRMSDPDSRLSLDDSRRDSSPASKDSLSSYGSNSTLTGNECSDDSVIMTRQRKIFEQKEEFLRRPSHPIGWLLPDDPTRIPKQAVIQREFYARPQKLQRQVWPPGEQRSPTRNPKFLKPFNQHVQRVKTDIDEETTSATAATEYSKSNDGERSSSVPMEDAATARERFYNSSQGSDDCCSKENLPYAGKVDRTERSNAGAAARERTNGINNKAAFVTTLTRIHENVTSNNQNQSQEVRNGASSSLPSSPGPEKKVGDKFPLPPQGLQIVSRRAKQFESGRLLSDDDEPTNDRTNLYKSELSRLSSKRSVPNVAVRKREFESKAESQEVRRSAAATATVTRESKSLDAESPAMEAEPVRLRARSNSAESWEAANGTSRRAARHTWQTDQDEESKRNNNHNNNSSGSSSSSSSNSSSSSGNSNNNNNNSKAKRQDSYLQAVKSQLVCESEIQQRQKPSPGKKDEIVILPSNESLLPTVTISPPSQHPHPAIRPNNLPILNPLRPLGHSSNQLPSTVNNVVYIEAILAPGNGTIGNGVVLRRQKNAQISDEDRATRRVSYLKATSGERMHVDSDLDLSDSEAAIPMPIPAHRSAHKRWRPPLFPSDITPLRRIFEDVTQAAYLHRQSHRNSIASGTSSGAGTPKDVEPVEREGSLHVKFAVSEGKRSTDRSWKQVWAVLRGPILYFYKDRHSQSPSATNDSDNAGQSMDVRCSSVDIAEDYTKRKHVLRIANLASEVLLQSEDATSMALWLNSLQKHAAAEQALESPSSTSKQQAVPQTPTSTSNASSAGSGQRLSPLPSHKGIRKLTSFRNRSPTGQSPVNKTRKASTTVEPLPSPKTKTWKGRVAKQLRRMHGQAESPSSPTAQLLPGATFKVRLENCPPSTDSEFVPFIVQLCTSIVEARGLEVIGIYRVPGNTAAIAQLTESVNKGFEHINLQDPRWSDVNVISSLLKSFFRQLPDSLFTAELYPMFIDADKIEDPQRRMTTIRKLLRDLPAHHYETLKFLMAHLKKVVDHSEINKMEAKNLAIVFGPTLVRASGSRDNMVTMVTDMSHQCRIVESLLNNVDWFFSDEDLDDLSRLSVSLSLPADGNEAESTSTMNHNLLLNNIQKVEGMREIVSARDIVSSIISAANRKIQRRRKGQDETDHEEPDDEKGKANPNVDNLGTVRQSMALNERQCSVSEIVQMHENKSQTIHTNHPMEQQSDRNAFVVVNHHHHHHHHHNNNNSGSSGSTGTSTSSGSGGTNNNSNSSGSANNNNNESSTNATISPASRYKNSSSAIVQGFVSDSSSPRGGSLDSATGNFIDGIANSNVSGEKQGNNDDIAIRTYAGLSATTQERIRRFEQETKAMLQRDQHRQRREAEKREEERRRIEMEWQLAKREMENDDILDSIVDNTVSPNFLSDRLASINERLTDRSMADLSERHARSKSSSRMMPLSIAVQQQPTARQKAHASSQLSGILGEKMNNAVIKKFKTDKETSSLDSVSLAPTRYGSLDSLHEVHASPSPSPSQQRGLPGDSSDDGPSSTTSKTSNPCPSTDNTAATASSPTFQLPESGNKTLNKFLRGSDLLTSLTSTFDRKWRSLVNPSSQSSQQTCHESCSRVVTESCSDLRQAGRKEDDAAGLSEVYRDPSLHKSVDKNRLSRLKDDVAEKDTDSTVMEDGNEEGNVDSTPDNDKKANLRKSESGKKDSVLDAAEKDENGSKKTTGVPQGRSAKRVEAKPSSSEATGSESGRSSSEVSYSNMLEKFESLSQGSSSESRSRLKRSESLNKRSESAITKLKRSESLNKHSERPTSSPTIAGNSKLKRSESLNKHSADRSESPNSKLKRSESLTKTEKTECNISKRRQSGRKENATKLKRKNGMPERSIKRRHTVGGTKDFDKVHWLDNKLQAEAEKIVRNDCKPKKSQLRTSSPDLSSNRVNVSDASFLIEVSFRGPSNVVFNVTNARPQSLPDASLPSKVFKVPLESHV